MTEKLNNLSKILIATGQINYMASSIYDVNQQMKFSGLDKKDAHKEGVEAKDELLEDVVERLAGIMEDLGNLINAHDCVCHIDERVSKVPFEIVVHGMDDVEADYEEQNAE
jgi:hypothetical protein